MLSHYFKKTDTFEIKKEKSLNERKEYSKTLLQKYQSRVPVMIKKSCEDKILQNIDNHGQTRYLMPKNLSISEIMFIIRNKIDLKPEQAIYMFVNGTTLVPMNETISTIYDLYKSDDGFLYIVYRTENTFG